MAINKVAYGNTTLIDLTDTTATASDVASGKYFYTNAGVRTQGTASGGGGGMNVQADISSHYVSSSSLSASGLEITVATSGTYTVSWTGWRAAAANYFSSRLYKNGSATGSTYSTFSDNYGQYVKITNVSLSAGDVIKVYGRNQYSSWYKYAVCNLIIEQTP